VLRILALELLFKAGEIRQKISLEESHAITHGSAMQTVTATKARSMIYKLIDDALESHEPIQITGKRSNAFLVAEDDWRAIQESLYLVSIPGMRESIRSGLATPVSACAKKLDW
jgi:PHD/YefM family antitoxin component YafN of YafNO toxin-antitoxin module